ncbi:MAG: DUF4349 domain-containing protein [Thermoleophilaceae bacterium]|nr:DUF4349 domain-containing protein [Thermoleophilaceae bacterium]
MNSPDSTMERDLLAIDDALRDMPRDPDPEVGALQDLALALRSDAPDPDAEFALLMRERVKAGFPQARRRWLPSPQLRSLIPAVGFAGMLLVALSVAVIALPGGGSGGGGDDDEGGAAMLEAAPSDGAGSGGGAVQSMRAAPEAAADSGFVPGRSDRRIERSVALELGAPVDRMERLAEQVTAVTNRLGGFVLSSSLSTGEDSAGGDFDLRIPAARLRPALRELSGLATVRSQSQSGRDVTRQHVTAQDRLRSARAERASLLRRLENATTDAEAEGLRQRLDLVAIEIRGLRARLRDLRLATNYATVTVSLVAEDGDSGAGGIGDAVDDAGKLLVGGAGILIRVLAVALPLGLVALAVWLGGTAWTRRRRESALV